MACMEHECVDCNWWLADNNTGPGICPKCGGRVIHTFDEEPEDNNDEEEEEDVEDEEDEEDESV